MKYPKYKHLGVSYRTLETETLGTFSVFKNDRLCRWYLVKDEREIAWKHLGGRDTFSREDLRKWALKWHRNAQDQCYRLEERMEKLEKEKDEIVAIMW